ncbi:MAG: Ig-like domain-containing protein [Oscillospiraceae bacterium]|nr:Ig-like domain-containing protein [Oscillospiraceae bacterium]
MKKFFMILLAVLLCCGLFACGDKDNEKEDDSVIDTTPEVWQEVRGNFARGGSSQYNNATLQMLYLGNGCVMFEFNLMEGSESEDWAWDVVLPFVALIDDDGVGCYESDPESENPLRITLELSEDGQTVTATHTGEMPISCEGVYAFMSDGLEVSEVSAAAILDHLPTAATSLNHNLGAYKMTYSEEVIANWFYPVTATFDDTDAVLAKFIIAKDLSAVYRVDDDIDPVLIFGSTQTMLDYESYVYPDADEETDGEPIAVPLVDVISEAGLMLEPGSTSKLIVVLPWDFDCAIETASSNASVVTVNAAGEIKAVAAGTATISGTITVDDGSKVFEIEVSVRGEGGDAEAVEALAEEAAG